MGSGRKEELGEKGGGRLTCLAWYVWWRRIWRCLLGGCRGATTAEYALILALVVVILIGSLTSLGSTLNAKLQGIINSLNATQ